MIEQRLKSKGQCPQLKLRLLELRGCPEKRRVFALQGEVVDKGLTATQSLLGFNRFSHYVTRTSLNLFVNACEVFANDTEADHQKTSNDEFQ